ncbi:NADH dehydrogenase [ubiquinone] 1 alpha subcomplex subunit 5-like [Nycticebus coucang]|uniref:NADH dehydrogenase [ubiquinone] 1 alpha subcomplex subunit 5-like n=1 Tax=Nycticebus coucang TaxID=9470 RepID=UPI00234C91CC|nr:NADH dehydrogenase [ubiquinone] 1 alpha subcomplex subunit 5-like [Nycticebus coucang]
MLNDPDAARVIKQDSSESRGGCLQIERKQMRKPTGSPNPRSRAVMAGALKKTTGLVGLAVCETPHEGLRILYTKILDVFEQIPKTAAYRKHTEQITNEKLAMVKAEPDVKKLEDQLRGGQIEEVILQAEHELSLARKMMQWKPWETLVEEAPANQWKWPI